MTTPAPTGAAAPTFITTRFAVTQINDGLCLIDPTDPPQVNYAVTWEAPMAAEVNGVQQFPGSEATSYDLMFGDTLFSGLQLSDQSDSTLCLDGATVDYSTHVCRIVEVGSDGLAGTSDDAVYIIYVVDEQNLGVMLSAQTYNLEVRGSNDSGDGPWTAFSDVTCKDQ